MKSYRKELWFNHPQRRGFINITREVQKAVDESGVREGLLLCNAMHITASVFINDNESGLFQDWEAWLEKLAPEKPYSQYRHNDSGEPVCGISHTTTRFAEHLKNRRVYVRVPLVIRRPPI